MWQSVVVTISGVYQSLEVLFILAAHTAVKIWISGRLYKSTTSFFEIFYVTTHTHTHTHTHTYTHTHRHTHTHTHTHTHIYIYIYIYIYIKSFDSFKEMGTANRVQILSEAV